MAGSAVRNASVMSDPRCAVPFEPQYACLRARNAIHSRWRSCKTPVPRDDDPAALRDVRNPDAVRCAVGKDLLVHVNDAAALLTGIPVILAVALGFAEAG